MLIRLVCIASSSIFNCRTAFHILYIFVICINIYFLLLFSCLVYNLLALALFKRSTRMAKGSTRKRRRERKMEREVRCAYELICSYLRIDHKSAERCYSVIKNDNTLSWGTRIIYMCINTDINPTIRTIQKWHMQTQTRAYL